MRLRNGLLGLVFWTVSFPAAAQLDVANVDLLKSIPRADAVASVPNVLICVTGTNVVSAIVTVPSALPRQEDLFAEEPFPDDFCLFDDSFANPGELETAFPPGSYVFDIVGPGTADSITVDFSATEPGAFLAVDTPAAGATGVSADADLTIGWTPMVKSAPCLPASCSDSIGVFVVRQETGEEVAGSDALPPDAVEALVAAEALSPSTAYVLELETYNGVFDEPGLTDQGDAVLVARAWEDINTTTFTTPEPGAAALGAAALSTLAGLKRRSRTLRN